jgi:glycosyltransferase involved in cell wall biosynthesis
MLFQSSPPDPLFLDLHDAAQDESAWGGAQPRDEAAALPRVLIVAEHISMKMGGEAARPLHYFRVMRSRGIEAWLVVHSRTRDELRQLLGEDFHRAYFVPDTFLHKLLWKIGQLFPHQVRIVTFGAAGHLLTQIMQRKLVKKLVRQHRIDIVHEPIPISPKQPSMTYNVGAPVVIGPLNGNINYPPAFGHMESPLVRASVRLSRFSSNLVNRLIPGKLLADTIIVSNPRTRDALPAGCRGRVVELVANAVDLATWTPPPRKAHEGPCRFAFLGRLVDFKMVDLLLESFRPVADKHQATLDIIGDGPDRPKLQSLARSLRLGDRVTFSGWMSPRDGAARLGQADVLVFPSLRECGGAVVMEAMAVGLPVIAANWGGPADYVGRDGSGILIDPTTRPAFMAGLTDAMMQLAASKMLRDDMSHRARQRALRVFNWEARVDALLEIYRQTIEAKLQQKPQSCRLVRGMGVPPML